MYKNGKAVDPLKVKAPPVKPIKEENLIVYQDIRNQFVNELIDFDLRPYATPANLLLRSRLSIIFGKCSYSNACTFSAIESGESVSNISQVV